MSKNELAKNENDLMKKQALITGVIIVLAGGIALASGILIEQPALCVLGAGLLGFSVVLLFRIARAYLNPVFAKKLELDTKDERLRQIYVNAGNSAFWIVLFVTLGMSIAARADSDILLFSPAIFLIIYIICALYYHKKL